jgi:2-desacetyl-2-hydroxyethyl bacteriochlorophyllide A dehydrogenase
MHTRCLVFTAAHTAEFHTRELSSPRKNEVLVQNRYSLISPGTELALYTGSHIGFSDPEITWARYPIEPGYASVGDVIESESDRLSPGTRIMHYGAHAGASLFNVDAVPWAVLPSGLDEKEACFGRFSQIAYSSVAAALRPPGRVRVYGAGIVGNLAAQWFSLSGADFVGIRDLSKIRLEKARKCGVKIDVAAGTLAAGAAATTVAAETSNDPPNTIVEATGVPAVVKEALSEVAPFGQVILLGSTRGQVELNVYKLVHRKAVLLSGAHETILGDTVREVLADSLKRLKDGSLQTTPLITHVISPAELPGIYPQLIEEPDTYLGVFVDWRLWND